MEDEENWDEEVQAVHALLGVAGPLDDDARIMRLQIASHEPCHYGFPDSIHRLLSSIGTGVADRGLVTGCDGHFGRTTDLARIERIRAYASVVQSWADGHSLAQVSSECGHPDDVGHIYNMLGEKTPKKAAYARRVALLIELIAQESRGYRFYSDRCCYPAAAEIDREILALEGVVPDTIDDVIKQGMELEKGAGEAQFRAVLREVSPFLARSGRSILRATDAKR